MLVLCPQYNALCVMILKIPCWMLIIIILMQYINGMDDKVTKECKGEVPVELNIGVSRDSHMGDSVTYPDWFWCQGLRIADLLSW